MFNVGDVTRRNVPGDANAYPNTQSDTNCIHSTMAYHSRAHSPIASSRGALPPIVTTANPTARSAKSRYNDEVHTPTTHYIESRLFAAAPVRLRRRLRIHKRSVALGLVALLLLFSFVFFDFLYDRIVEFYARPASTAAAEVWGVEEFDAPTGARSVLVQHHGAMDRLNVTLPEEDCALPPVFCSTIRLSPQLLPSWTLHMVRPQCTWCSDAATYGQAVKGVTLVPEHAVFATSSAPLGRIGPMLFAMSSVTDDIPLSLELPHWMWMRHVYPNYAEVSWEKDAAPDVAPYLAVMGIPSTDQPARVALRTAQRATWMSYQEVARTENNFEGALLPLFLFAAAEPFAPARKVGQPGLVAAAANCLLCNNLTALLPTEEEFLAASTALMAMEAGQHYGGPGLEERRVRLRTSWREESLTASPCEAVVAEQRPGDAASPAVSYLSAALSLPVMPAFVAPAQYICCASAALWKEALTHRNVVWIDMMTDRRPTTNKKLGENKKWGLPVEVGMSQKLILWLEYAYHAFPGVPYIMKGDDDAYLKVPQFLNDVRFIVRGRGVRYLARNETLLMPREAPVLANESICTYWGSTRSFSGTRFNAGMAFLLHRRVAQAVLEPATKQPSAASFTAATQSSQDQRDHVQLAMMEFNPSLSEEYVRLEFHHEDVMLGFLIRSRLAREQAMCPYHKMFYVKETFTRFHDLRVGRARKLTWASVVVHRCHVTDFSFVHYFFMHEYNRTAPASATLAEEEAAAQAAAAAWVAEKKAQMPMYDTWDSTPDVQWVSRGNGPVAPAYVVDPQDAVAVYMHSYNELHQPQFHVYDGYVSDP